MPKTRAQKEGAVAELTQVMKAGKAAVFADFQGMTVQAVSDLRKKLRAEQVDYIVAKKTLMSRAAKEAGYEIDFRSMPGMLGVAITKEDEMAPARIVGEVANKKDAMIKLVGGIFEGGFVDQEFVVKLSKLPSKPQLLTQLLWVLNGPTGAFVRLLNAYKEDQEGAPAAEAPTPEAKVEEAAPAPAEAPAQEEAKPEAPAPAQESADAVPPEAPTV
jgi:large subunit ribosomal protein L10